MTSLFRFRLGGLIETAGAAAVLAALASASGCSPFAGSDTAADTSTPSNANAGSNMPGAPDPQMGSGTTSGSQTNQQNNSGDQGSFSAACASRVLALQAALDNSTEYDAVLAISTPDCGRQILVSTTEQNLTTESLHRIGGITKTFVSVVILSLMKEGRLQLTDEVDSYGLWGSTPNPSHITIKELLNHTSGIYNYSDDSNFDSTQSYTPQALVALAKAHSNYFAPGTGFHLSNTNYILLGMIAEQVTGKPLAQLVRERALVPAGLKSTFFAGGEPISGTLATGWNGDTDVTSAADPSALWASGAMVATPGDLLDWIDAVYGGSLLDADEKSLLLDSGGTSMGSGTEIKYGLGVMEYPGDIAITEGPSLGHDGATRGYRAQASYFTTTKTGIVIIGDDSNADVNSAVVAVLTALAATP
jgi:D-alanyl-D-alanine carboxypeptidase